jgi:hypothetical protein
MLPNQGRTTGNKMIDTTKREDISHKLMKVPARLGMGDIGTLGLCIHNSTQQEIDYGDYPWRCAWSRTARTSNSHPDVAMPADDLPPGFTSLHFNVHFRMALLRLGKDLIQVCPSLISITHFYITFCTT